RRPALGARVHLPRALIAAAFATGSAGCIDFVEPDLPERGAPAVVQVTIRLSEDSLSVEGVLAPGLDDGGFRRGVLRETLLVGDTAIEPTELERNGTRRYTAHWQPGDGAPAGPVRLEAPLVNQVVAPPPSLEWSGIRALDADTVVIGPGGDLV